MPQNHTPTPWEQKEAEVPFVSAGGTAIATTHNIFFKAKHYDVPANEEALANAAHIVKCVNAHDGLVDRLKVAIEQMELHPGLFDPTTMRAHKAALAKAEAR